MSTDASAVPKPGLWFWLVFAAILATGVSLRVWQLDERPFWRDEAWVALAAAETPWSGILDRADIPVPPLFLAAVKATGSLPGPAEVMMRLLPLLCGLATIPLVYAVARRLRAPRMVALSAMLVAAGSWGMANWSRELKQYQIEASLVLVLALAILSVRQETRRRAFWLTAGGAWAVCLLGPWLGYGVVFPFAAILATPILLPRGQRRQALWVAGVGAVVLAASLLLVMGHVGRAQSAITTEHGIMAAQHVQAGDLDSWMRGGGRAVAAVVYMFVPPTNMTDRKAVFLLMGLPFVALVVLGLAFWPRRTRRILVVWQGLPWLLMLAATLLKLYPFCVPRMMCWSVPMIVLAGSMGVVAAVRFVVLLFSSRGALSLVIALVVCCIPAVLARGIWTREDQWIHHDFPRVLAELQRERQPGEPVLVSLFASPCVRFYARGRDADFVYTPTVSGTEMLPGFDRRQMIEQVLATSPQRAWLLDTSDADILLRLLGDFPVDVRPICQAGEDPLYGSAR
ncbi:MAG: glycosyltransferase family 39 protein, partial [Planctomycetota bacterium]